MSDEEDDDKIKPIFNSKKSGDRKNKGVNIDPRTAKIATMGVFFLIFILIISSMAFVNVPAGHKGVTVSGLGNIGNTYNEGLQLKNPFVQVDIVRWNTQYVKETVSVLTADGYNVPIDFQVVYHLEEDRVGDIRVDNPEYEDTVIRNSLRAEVRKTAADMNLTGEDMNRKRTKFESVISEKVEERVTPYFITIESINIRNVDMPKTILNAAEQRASAKIDIDTAQYELNAEKARAQKEQVRAEAEANSTIILAEGQSESIKILAKQSENMTQEMMDYIMSLRYIAALRDPKSNVEFVIVPMDGQPIIMDISDMQELNETE